ncbi:hypothetical protein [Parendozoicomonas haliclonae]|uniref:Uncharacterized protein n=1 Tax=Parendozoicomonas haliclonae TaxID=1960125 RepID=A0A1X7ANM6_9GAMM|nr:hypothetical protein [Parendozoicomonas haliclonae]SMA49732.1 hypothetical protein EHSB41UT_03514 [Parendozoicomonas haliclonae]
MMQVAERARNEQQISDGSNSGISKRQGQAFTGERTVTQVDQPVDNNVNGVADTPEHKEGGLFSRAVNTCKPLIGAGVAWAVVMGAAIFFIEGIKHANAHGRVGDAFKVIAKDPSVVVTAPLFVTVVGLAALFSLGLFCHCVEYAQHRAEQAAMERQRQN